MNKWSPPNAPGNSPAGTANYVKFVEGAIGNGPIDRDNPQTMAKLISTMARFENGTTATERAGIEQQVQRVVVEFGYGAPAAPNRVEVARLIEPSVLKFTRPAAIWPFGPAVFTSLAGTA